MVHALRALSDEELRLARLLAWEEVKEAPEGSGRQEVWSGILAALVLEAARRGGAPVEAVMGAVEDVVRSDIANLPDADFRALRDAFGDYGSGGGPGSLVAVLPAAAVRIRFPRLERFWSAVKALVERGGDL